MKVVVCFAVLMTVVSGEQTCYSCAGVARKEDCNRMVECGANEVCFTRRTVSKTGNITFDFGCTQYSGCSSSSSLPVVGRKRDIDNEGSCVRCCDADAQGCSDRDSTNCGCNRDLCGLPDDSRVCFHCDHVIHPSDCTTTGLCYGDRVCSVFDSVGTGDGYYCNKCCDSHFCNIAFCN